MTTPTWPSVDVIVPVFNEAATIRGKLSNLARLHYPAGRLRVLVVDGHSDDGTADLAEAWGRGSGLHVAVIRSHAEGKPAQIAAGLSFTETDWVMVTDADARVPRHALQSMVALALSGARVGLVGTPVRPAGTDSLDQAHWTITNWLRRAEARLGSAGLAVGPCYLARRELLATLDEGTVADDVYVSCRALLAGYRIELAPQTVLEIRAPVGGRELLCHKLTKAIAYVRETARALPYARPRHLATSAVFFWRAGLLLVLPLLLLSVTAASIARLGWGLTATVAASMIALLEVLSALGRRGRVTRLAALAAAPVLTSLVLTAAVIVCPFAELSPRYRKVSLPEVSLLDTDPP